MHNKRLVFSLAGVAVVAAAAVTTAVMLSGSGNGDASADSGHAAGAGSTTISVRKTGLGSVLTDGRGRTLYLFEKDQPNRSSCTGACSGYWPAATASGALVAGAGTASGQLGRVPGSQQLTYAGHPLYTFVGDQAAGDTKGEGLDDFGAKWYAVDGAGRAVTSAQVTTNSAGGYGY